MKIFPYLLFAAVLSVIYVIIFILPNHVQGFALIPEKISQGEFWRFLTYPFDHIDMSHLLKNLIGLIIITAGVIELKTKFSDFSSVYILAGFLAVLPLWFILQFTALGASVAIYAIFGLIALESKKYEIKAGHVLSLFIFVILIESALSNSSTIILSSASHLSGLFFGVFSFVFANKLRITMNKRKIQCLRKI